MNLSLHFSPPNQILSSGCTVMIRNIKSNNFHYEHLAAIEHGGKKNFGGYQLSM